MSKIIVGLLGLSILINSFGLIARIKEHQEHQSGFLGDQFRGLETAFNHARLVGYYTDKDIDEKIAIAQFEQAQYILAPTVLDLNNTSRDFVIFDCTTPQVALQKIKDLKLQALKANNLGVILAYNPQAGVFKP